MGTQVRDEGSHFDSTIDTLGVGSTSQCHFSIMQDQPMLQFSRLVGETEGKELHAMVEGGQEDRDLEPEGEAEWVHNAGICPVMSQFNDQKP